MAIIYGEAHCTPANFVLDNEAALKDEAASNRENSRVMGGTGGMSVEARLIEAQEHHKDLFETDEVSGTNYVPATLEDYRQLAIILLGVVGFETGLLIGLAIRKRLSNG